MNEKNAVIKNKCCHSFLHSLSAAAEEYLKPENKNTHVH